MNIDEVMNIMQMLMLQNMASIGDTDGGGSGSSEMFGMILQSMLQNMVSSEQAQFTSSNSIDASKNINFIEVAQDVKDNMNKNIPMSINEAIKISAQKYGVDEDFIKAVIKQESSFNPNSVSRCGAQGLMQLMPSTAQSLGVTNPFDTLQNVDAGTRYLKGLMNSYNGSKELALSAYNGGSGRMKRRGVDTVAEINKMPKETVAYVDKVMRNYYKYKGLNA